MNLSRIKLLVGMLITMCLAIGVYIYLGDTSRDTPLNDQAYRDYQSLEKMLVLTQSMVYDRLVESSYLLAENSTFKANLQLNDKKSIDYSAGEFALFLKTDLFAIIGRNDDIKFDYNNRLDEVDDLAQLYPIKKALLGYEPAIEFQNVELLHANDTIYQIVAVPIFAGKQKILGVVVMGINFMDSVLKPLAHTFPFDLILYFDEQFISCSAPNLVSSDVNKKAIADSTGFYHKSHSMNYSGEIRNNQLSFTKDLNHSKKATLISVYNPDRVSNEINP